MAINDLTHPAITYLDSARTEGELKTSFFGPVLNDLDELDRRTDEAPQDLQQILFNEVRDLLDGTTEGSEGAWNIVEVGEMTKTAQQTTIVIGAGTVSWIGGNVLSDSYGTIDYIDHRFSIYVRGLTSWWKAVSIVNGNGFYLHPKDYGKYPVGLGTEFSGDITYIVLAEDTDNKTSGTQTRTEYFIGSNVDTQTEIESVVGGSAPRDGAINLGYYDGKTWTDQNGDGAKTVFKLNRKGSTPTLVERYTGTWATESGWTFDSGTNSATLSTALGDSEALRVTYDHNARVVRNGTRVAPVHRMNSVMYYNSSSVSFGADIVSDTTGEVPENTPQIGRRKVTINQDGSFGIIISSNTNYCPQHDVYSLGSIGKNAAKLLFDLVNISGNLYVQVYFNELTYDTDWGDNGFLIGSDNTITTTDDNGNIIQFGCLHYDTGIRYVAK